MWWRWACGDAMERRRQGRQGGRGAGWAAPLALLGLIALCLLGCAPRAGASGSATKTVKPSTSVVPTTKTPTSAPTAAPVATPVEITDLGQFRQKLADAIGSNKWASVMPLLGPEFSFQSPHAGAHLLMPYSQQNLQTVYQGAGPWSQSDYYTSFFSCYAGTTPGDQVIGFVGGGGSYGSPFLLFGMAKWQGYWVVQWAFDNPIGADDGISCHLGEG